MPRLIEIIHAKLLQDPQMTLSHLGPLSISVRHLVRQLAQKDLPPRCQSKAPMEVIQAIIQRLFDPGLPSIKVIDIWSKGDPKGDILRLNKTQLKDVIAAYKISIERKVGP